MSPMSKQEVAEFCWNLPEPAGRSVRGEMGWGRGVFRR